LGRRDALIASSRRPSTNDFGDVAALQRERVPFGARLKRKVILRVLSVLVRRHPWIAAELAAIAVWETGKVSLGEIGKLLILRDHIKG
jgi:hypothetical protein